MKKQFILISFFIYCPSLLWSRQGTGIMNIDEHAIDVMCGETMLAINHTGKVWEAGTLDSSMIFNSDTLKSTSATVFIIMCDKNGNLQWVRQSLLAHCYLRSVAVDTNGNSYITGLSDSAFRVVQASTEDILWKNPGYLTNDTLANFNDSIQGTALGTILQVDTLLNYPAYWNGATMSLLTSVIPANLQDSSLYFAAFCYLTDKMTGNLSPTQLSQLRTLAHQCPLTYGKAVYQAREVLVGYDTAGTIYFDTSCTCWSGGGYGKDVKKKQTDTSATPTFSLYPNPNNGGFTVEWTGVNNQSSLYLSLFDMLGELVKSYQLNPALNSVFINESTLNSGIYFYRITVNNSNVKEGKLVIIK